VCVVVVLLQIFYPDLIDKTQAPSYRILPDPLSPDGTTSIIRFHAGPPYEVRGRRAVAGWGIVLTASARMDTGRGLSRCQPRVGAVAPARVPVHLRPRRPLAALPLRAVPVPQVEGRGRGRAHERAGHVQCKRRAARQPA
jgi:hypothetical protein